MAKPTGSCVSSVKEMAYMLKDTEMSNAVEETEDSSNHKPEEDFATSLSAKLLSAIRYEVQSADGGAKRCVLRRIIEESLRDIFLDGYEAGLEKVQDPSYQFIKYVLTHVVAAGRLDAILVQKFDKWSHSDAFLVGIAHRIASSSKFLEPMMVRESALAADIDGSERPSKSRGCRRLMSPPQRATSDSGSNSSVEIGSTGRSCLETERKKGQ